jgi:hypothetical protein
VRKKGKNNKRQWRRRMVCDRQGQQKGSIRMVNMSSPKSREGPVEIGLLFGAKSRLADTVGSVVVRLEKLPLYSSGDQQHSATADSGCRPEEGAVEVLRRPIGWWWSQR